MDPNRKGVALKPKVRRGNGAALKVAVYARVSTTDKGQMYENQLLDLREYLRKQQPNGWELYHEYVDQASAKNGERAQFKALLADAAQRKFDLILFWSLDRFSREGVLATLQYLQRLTVHGVDWFSYREEFLRSTGPFRDAAVSIIATIAQLERERISERTKAGMARAKAAGKKFGRPRLQTDPLAVVKLWEQGVSYGEIAKRLKISKTSVHRFLQQRRTVPKRKFEEKTRRLIRRTLAASANKQVPVSKQRAAQNKRTGKK